MRKRIRRKKVRVVRINARALFAFAFFAAALLFCVLITKNSMPQNSLLPLFSDAGSAYSEPVEDAVPDVPISVELVDIDEGVSNSIRLELLYTRSAENITLTFDEPSVLIYHTHTTEAYTQSAGYEYEESGEWRTHDNEKNITAVGEKLTRLLREQYGINVIHDITDHEPPKLSTSYSRSVKTMEKYKEQYPSITMFIDVHRDAYGSSPSGREDYVTVNGKECARIMFVVGTGEGATGAGFGEKPDFQANYALAKRITEKLSEFDSGLTRNIRVKTGRYNQHISDKCLLVEIGHNANTLNQALNSVELLAEAIASVAGVKIAGTLELVP